MKKQAIIIKKIRHEPAPNRYSSLTHFILFPAAPPLHLFLFVPLCYLPMHFSFSSATALILHTARTPLFSMFTSQWILFCLDEFSVERANVVSLDARDIRLKQRSLLLHRLAAACWLKHTASFRRQSTRNVPGKAKFSSHPSDTYSLYYNYCAHQPRRRTCSYTCAYKIVHTLLPYIPIEYVVGAHTCTPRTYERCMLDRGILLYDRVF